MLTNLHLLQFNNYYNRKLLRLPNLNYYEEYCVYHQMNVSFNPNDYITSSVVVNSPNADYNYMVVADNNNNIISRWFVIEAKYEKGEALRTSGQYTLTVSRDVLADYYDDIINNSVCFIDKAYLQYGDKYLFNSENQIYNQIKKEEALLKDETGCGWLVGYVAASALDNIEIVTPADDSAFPAPPISYNELLDLNGYIYDVSDPMYQFIGEVGSGSSVLDRCWSITLSNNAILGATEVPYVYTNLRYDVNRQEIKEEAARKLLVSVQERQEILMSSATAYTRANVTGTYKNAEYINTLSNMNNTWFQDGSTIFKISIGNRTQTLRNFAGLNNNAGSIYTTMKEVFTESGVGYETSNGNSGYNLFITTTGFNFTIEVYNGNILSTILKSSARVLGDAPYRMFAIPVGAPKSVYNGQTFYPVGDIAKKFAMRLATVLGGTGASNIYDLQYLPYCPVRNAINENGEIELFGSEFRDFNLIKSGDTITSYMLWASVSNFSFNIKHKITVPTDPIEFKIANETKFCRLNSPNYSSSYEFKPTYNYGVEYFEVNCSYKPYQPYIQINPRYSSNGLFGGDFNDQRGLVCVGDFSVAMVDDAWIDYQIQNKSWENVKQRTVENMSTTFNINYKQQKTASGWAAVGQVISGAGSGAMIGGIASAGNPMGYAIGGGVGAIAGLATGLGGRSSDLKAMRNLQAESLDYFNDTFEMNNANIQALPYSLGKVDAFSINNKIFPFLEFYEATEEEVDALRKKLTYHGMNVGRIDTISNYIQPFETFISARLIRTNIKEDYHLVDVIANELHTGFYV